ncbi:hypothetical protein LTS00_018343, partial [Friedmanniomyces endolithicus]
GRSGACLRAGTARSRRRRGGRRGARGRSGACLRAGTARLRNRAGLRARAARSRRRGSG